MCHIDCLNVPRAPRGYVWVHTLKLTGILLSNSARGLTALGFAQKYCVDAYNDEECVCVYANQPGYH